MSSTVASALICLIGVLSHVVYFARGEHHMYGKAYLISFLASYVFVNFILRNVFGHDTSSAWRDTSTYFASYFSGLYSSLLTYRVLLNPLNKIAPHPWGARISHFWPAWTLVTRRKGRRELFRLVTDLHEQYGDVVRIGPNTISVIRSDATQAIHGMDSTCTKADFYDLTAPFTSMETMRDSKAHARRRRLWSGAFGERSLREYEERISTWQDKLLARVNASTAKTDSAELDVRGLMELYTYDVMGDLALGRSFDMLELNQEHYAVTMLHKFLAPLGYELPKWFFRVLLAIPGASKDWWNFMKYCDEMLEERLRKPSSKGDVLSTLLKQYGDRRPPEADMPLLRGDAQLVLVAGSDTTSTVLTHLLAHLACSPVNLRLLQDEVGSTLPSSAADDDVLSDLHLKNLPHLDAIILEALRLHPAVPSAIPRKTPKEGLVLGSEAHGAKSAPLVIPSDTVIWTPQHAINRKKSLYAHPDDFLPARWTTDSASLILDRPGVDASYAPFSVGRYSCIGKPLAMLNIRTTIARLVAEYDIEPAEDGTTEIVRGDVKGTTEGFTIRPGVVNVKFRRRNKGLEK